MPPLLVRAGIALRLGAAAGLAFGLVAAVAEPTGAAHALGRQIPKHVILGAFGAAALLAALRPWAAPDRRWCARLAGATVAGFAAAAAVSRSLDGAALLGETRLLAALLALGAFVLGLARLLGAAFARVLPAVPTPEVFLAALLLAGAVYAPLPPSRRIVLVALAALLAALVAGIAAVLRDRLGASWAWPGPIRAAAWALLAGALAVAAWRAAPRPASTSPFLRSAALPGRALLTLGREVREVVPAGEPLVVSVAGARRLELGWGLAEPVSAPVHFTASLEDGTARRLVVDERGAPAAQAVPFLAARTVELPADAAGARLVLRADASTGGAFWTPPVLSGRPAEGRPNVVLVSLDTVRADHLDAYGYARRSTSPELLAWAQEGTLFENAIACAPATLSSQMSILTGLHPTAHGVSYARWRADERMPVLGPSVPTLAELLSARGWLTAAFTGAGYFALPVGYSRGFATYVSSNDETLGGAATVFEKGLSWLEAHREDAFFLFLHTYEAHEPYLDQRFASAEGLGPQDAAARQEALYDGDLRRADAYLGRLRRKLEELGLLGRTLLVIVSDHGEEFGDHFPVWSDGHGHALYEEQVRVPFVAIGPGIQRGRRLRQAVDLTAVAPTVLEFTATPVPPALPGRRLLELLRGGAEPEGDEWAAFSGDLFAGDPRQAVRTRDWKLLVRGPDLPERFLNTPERRRVFSAQSRLAPTLLFHLPDDPRERDDRAGREGTVAARLRALLEAHLRRPAAAPAGGLAVEDEVRERLKAAGYLD